MKGFDDARTVWNFISSGVEKIRATITTNQFACDYEDKDTLVLATNKRGIAHLERDHAARTQAGYASTFHTHDDLKHLINAQGYSSALSYNNTFSIKAFAYIQELKKLLQAQGVQIYEESAVVERIDTGVRTAQARVSAKKVIVAADYQLSDLAPFAYDLYHVQTFLLASAPLPESVAHAFFPTKKMVAWDTDLIYHYFRLTADNRLLLGGATIFHTYAQHESYRDNFVFKLLNKYAHTHFPDLPLQWEYMWPGLIGITKDLFPLAGADKNNKNIYYISGAAGLAWACALGNYAVDALYDNRTDFDHLFDPYRRFFIPHAVQTIIGKRLAFALSNFKQVGSL